MSIVDQYPDSYQNFIAGTIYAELVHAMNDTPPGENREKYIVQKLEEIFKDVDWSRSFESPMIIVHDEIIFLEIFFVIHQWLRTKCANIENITMLTTHHLGLSQWWKQWCQVNHEKSFSIVELWFGYSRCMKSNMYSLPDLPTVEHMKSQKKIEYYFNYYGGIYPNPKMDRIYQLLKMLELRPHGRIEYLGKLYDKQHILNYAEYITYYKNQKEIDQLSQWYDQHTQDNYLTVQQPLIEQVPRQNENFLTGYQLSLDNRCFVNVVRETIDCQPFVSVTEKTLRAFLHHMAVVPLGYRAVEYFERLGFWFPCDIIDYSYQHQSDFAERVSGMIQSMKQFIATFSLEACQTYYNNNISKFHNNVQLVYELVQDPYIINRKINQ